MEDNAVNCLKVKRGEELPHSKLTENDVKRIRLNKYGWTAKQWAEFYGLHIRTIEHVQSYRSWRHV